MAATLVMRPGPFEQTFVPHPIEAPNEIWLWLVQWFLRRCFKSVDDDGWRRTTEAYLSYKLTKWAFGSGKLKIVFSEKNTTDFENRLKHKVNILCVFLDLVTSPYPTEQCQSILQPEISIHFLHFRFRRENLIPMIQLL